MTTLYRIRSIWTGFSGAPGYTNMYFGTTDPLAAGAQTAANDVKAFWELVKVNLPDVVHIAIEGAVALVEDLNGQQTGELALSSTPAPSVGTQSVAYFAPAGASVNWGTSSFLYGRRVKGRTYIVPLAANCSDVGGTLLDTVKTSLNTAAAGLVAAPSQMVVFTRPRDAVAADPARGIAGSAERPGSSSLVTSGTVRDVIAVLRSRRD